MEVAVGAGREGVEPAICEVGVGAAVDVASAPVTVGSDVGDGSASTVAVEVGGKGVAVALSPEHAANAEIPANARISASRRLDKAMFPYSSPAH